MMQIPLFKALESSRRILLAGCGGGFDVVSGLPLYVCLKAAGCEVFLGNLSFSRLDQGCRFRIAPAAWRVDRNCDDLVYFPERHLVDWLESKGFDAEIIGFERTGIGPLTASYETVARTYDIDTVILVDGGTDSLVKGDEALLGTVEEDAASIIAVNEVKGPAKFLVCLGFGIDQYHGICHHSFLENTAEMIRDGGFLGCISVQDRTPEGEAFLDAVEFLNARQPQATSIVANSIASAMRGEFGDHHATSRTRGSELFINPLMTLYWCYDLEKVAARIGFYEKVVATTTLTEVQNAIRL
jgi:hypothetical protein